MFPQGAAQESGTQEVVHPDLPTIEVNNRQLRDTAADAVLALQAANEPPTIFSRDSRLVHVNFHGYPKVTPYGLVELKAELARKADFVNTTPTKDGPRISAARPPTDVILDILARPDQHGFPALLILTATPIYSKSGDLVSSEGYHQNSGIYLHLQDLQLPTLPNPVDAIALFRELLCDFPFVHAGGFAHALSAMLLPFVRLMIDGPTPLHLVEASTRGTGKSLLCEVIALVALGTNASVMVQPAENAELEKRVTATLLEGSRMILLDNVHNLGGETLAAALTARMWQGRQLGRSEMVVLKNDALWMATGNNVTLHEDMIRRTVPIRLDSGVERPEYRSGFKHPNLLLWVKENRPALIAACLSLIEAWKHAGRPEEPPSLGSYERWCAVLGGILNVAGIPGFLQGREYLYEDNNAESEEWSRLCETLYATYGSKSFVAGQVLVVMQKNKTHGDLWEGLEKLKQQQRIGHALRRQRDRVFNGYRLTPASHRPKNHNSNSSNCYRVEKVS